MRILGIDPGETTGWVLYDAEAKRVLARGAYRGRDGIYVMAASQVRGIVAIVEKPVPQGATYPHVVETAYTTGRIVQQVDREMPVHTMSRMEACSALSDAIHGAFQVKGDGPVKAALKLLHGGEDAAKKGGPLEAVTKHEWAALAVAYAYALREGVLS